MEVNNCNSTDSNPVGQLFDDFETKGYTYLTLALGYKLGLFNHITDVPQTSSKIAELSGCKERYVREWLAVMASAQILNVDDGGQLFSMPKKHLDCLIGGQNGTLSSGHTRTDFWLAAFPMLLDNFSMVEACFRKNGPFGIERSKFSKFNDVMTRYSAKYMENCFVETILNEVPMMTDKCNVGAKHLDVGCGLGVPTRLLCKAFPKSTSIGLDIDPEVIEVARNKAKMENLSNAEYIVADASHMPADWSNMFDYVTTFSAVNDCPEPEAIFKEIYRVLKPGGYYSLLAYDSYSNVAKNAADKAMPLVYTWSLFCTVPLGCAKDGQSGLGTAYGKDVAKQMLLKAGFVDLTFHSNIAPTAFMYHCVAKKP